MQCQQHGLEFVLKPGGVSKTTGKPYNAFWACSGRNEDGTYCKNKPPKDYRPTPAQTFNSQLDHSGKAMDLDKRDEKRGDGMSWGNAKTNSVNWAIALYTNGGMKPDQMKNWIEKCANWIHNLEPKEEPTIHTPVTERIIQVEELPNNEEDNVDLSTIPF